MPQQFYTNDYVGNAAPIQKGITNLTNNLQTGLKEVGQEYQKAEVAKQEQDYNIADINQLRSFFEPVGIQTDWKSLLQRTGESKDQYNTRFKQEVMPLFDQLDQKGFDPREISAAAKIPGIGFDQLVKLRDKRIGQDTGALLKGELPTGAKQAIQQGAMSIDDINKKYGTNLTQDEYNKVVGLAEPDAAFQHVPGSQTDFKLAATAYQPAPLESKPVSYSQARNIVDNADLPAEQKTQFNPQLQSIADKTAAQGITPGQTAIGYYGNMQKEGLSLTPMSEKVGGAYTTGDALAFKRESDARKAKGSENTMLQSKLKSAIFQQTMAEKYGDKGIAMANRIYDLSVKSNDLLQRRERAAAGQHETGKLVEDPFIIDKQLAVVEAEQKRLEAELPGFERMVQNYETGPMILRNFDFNKGSAGANPYAATPAPKTNSAPASTINSANARKKWEY